MHPDWPQIVFMGVCLTARRIQHGDANKPDWFRYMRIDRVPRPQSSTIVHSTGAENQIVTSNEQSFGEVLFPGQTTAFEMDGPVSELQLFDF